MNLAFTYAGVVENNADPLGLGRVKARVPHVWGSDSTGSGYVPTNDLPWALPAGMPAGGSNSSGGFSQLPSVGDTVWLRFLDGEAEKPIWEWGMQTQNQAKSFKLHEYGQKSDGSTGAPDRAIVTRYGHSLEMKESRVTLTTKQGYQIVLDESTGTTGGSAILRTPKGQSLALNDLQETVAIQGIQTAGLSAETLVLNGATDIIATTTALSLLVGSTMIIVQDEIFSICTASGATFLIDANGNVALYSGSGCALSLENNKVQLGTFDGTGVVMENGKISINAPQAVINTAAFAVGTGAAFPVIMMTPAMLAYLLTHTHTNGNNGSPTGPPILVDPTVIPAAASTTMRTI